MRELTGRDADTNELRWMAQGLDALCNAINALAWQDDDGLTDADSEGLAYWFMLLHERIAWFDAEHLSSGQPGDDALLKLQGFVGLLRDNLHTCRDASHADGLIQALRNFLPGVRALADHLATLPWRDAEGTVTPPTEPAAH